ncbi:RagB/SusD family nutrient uptake outer membrane protein, partial [Klebsiella oxytoca]
YAGYQAYKDRVDNRPRPVGYTSNAQDYKPLSANVSLQYANREPRFYACVGFNGATWECESSSLSSEKNFQCWYYRDEVNG